MFSKDFPFSRYMNKLGVEFFLGGRQRYMRFICTDVLHDIKRLDVTAVYLSTDTKSCTWIVLCKIGHEESELLTN